jgi:hypothetical protein
LGLEQSEWHCQLEAQVSRLEGKVSALCLELKEVHELEIAQRAPIKKIDPCASILKIQLGANFSPRPIEYNMTQEFEPPLESSITSLKLVLVRPLKCPPLQEILTNSLVKRGLLKKVGQKLVVATVDGQQLAVEIGSPQWDNRTQADFIALPKTFNSCKQL